MVINNYGYFFIMIFSKWLKSPGAHLSPLPTLYMCHVLYMSRVTYSIT